MAQHEHAWLHFAVASLGAASVGCDGVQVRVIGSNTLGEELLPAMIESLCRQHGVSSIVRTTDVKERLTSITCSSGAAGFQSRATQERGGLPNDAWKGLKSIQFEVVATGSDSGRKDLIARLNEPPDASHGHGHLWMASTSLLGDLRVREKSERITETLIGSDGIAVIVSKRRDERSAIAKDDLRRIYNGELKSHDELRGGGPTRPIGVCVRPESGTTRDFEKFLGLPASMLDDARRYGERGCICFSNADCVAKVAEDPTRIGYASFAFADRESAVKTLGIVDGDAPPSKPTALSIFEGTFPHTRRLYLYSPKFPTIPEERIAGELAEYARQANGQVEVRRAGFVSMSVPEGHFCSEARFNVDDPHPFEVAFGPAGTTLEDSDSERMMATFSEKCAAGGRLFVYGYVASSKEPDYDRAVTCLRANSVSQDLEKVVKGPQCRLQPPVVGWRIASGEQQLHAAENGVVHIFYEASRQEPSAAASDR